MAYSTLRWKKLSHLCFHLQGIPYDLHNANKKVATPNMNGTLKKSDAFFSPFWSHEDASIFPMFRSCWELQLFCGHYLQRKVHFSTEYVSDSIFSIKDIILFYLPWTTWICINSHKIAQKDGCGVMSMKLGCQAHHGGKHVTLTPDIRRRVQRVTPIRQRVTPIRQHYTHTHAG